MTPDDLIAKLAPLAGCTANGYSIQAVRLIPPELRAKVTHSVVLVWRDVDDPFSGWTLNPEEITRAVAVPTEGGVRLTICNNDGRSRQLHVFGPKAKLAALVRNCTPEPTA